MEETARRSEFKDDLSIDAPITGQSLTAPLGDRPWQNPPEYVEVEDALEYYIPKVLDPEFSVELLDIIKMCIPLTTIANSMQNASVMEGIHNVDVGILALPAIVELLALVAKENDVPYKTGLEKPEAPEEMPVTQADIAMAMKDMDEEDPEVEETMPVEEVKSEPTGLMARREM